MTDRDGEIGGLPRWDLKMGLGIDEGEGAWRQADKPVDFSHCQQQQQQMRQRPQKHLPNDIEDRLKISQIKNIKRSLIINSYIIKYISHTSIKFNFNRIKYIFKLNFHNRAEK